jgi:hypothetical protein
MDFFGMGNDIVEAKQDQSKLPTDTWDFSGTPNTSTQPPPKTNQPATFDFDSYPSSTP